MVIFVVEHCVLVFLGGVGRVVLMTLYRLVD